MDFQGSPTDNYRDSIYLVFCLDPFQATEGIKLVCKRLVVWVFLNRKANAGSNHWGHWEGHQRDAASFAPSVQHLEAGFFVGRSKEGPKNAHQAAAAARTIASSLERSNMHERSPSRCCPASCLHKGNTGGAKASNRLLQSDAGKHAREIGSKRPMLVYR